MSIILQSTVGGFSSEFMRKLPLVEQAMREHGLEPSQCTFRAYEGLAA